MIWKDNILMELDEKRQEDEVEFTYLQLSTFSA